MAQHSNGPQQTPGASEEAPKCSLGLHITSSPGTLSVSLPPTQSTPGQPQLDGSRESMSETEKPDPSSAAVSVSDLPEDPIHQARQVFAGILALAAGLYDAWIIGNTRGFDISFDTVMVLTGLYLISGASGLIPSKTKTSAEISPK